MVELTERRYARPTVSRTFEGRDRFAPAAAWLAKGIQLAALGRPVTEIHRLDLAAAESTADAILGVIVRVDRFGNLVTNIDRKLMERFGHEGGITIEAGGKPIGRLVATYSELPADGVGALFGSTDHLELAAPSANASERLGLGRGAQVRVRRS
jgi:S-adenosylmethionine hydrolase